MKQLMNVASGGNLIQDINKSIQTKFLMNKKIHGNEVSHEVKIMKNSKLYKIIKSEKIEVNSAHHQSVKNLVKILYHQLLLQMALLKL